MSYTTNGFTQITSHHFFMRNTGEVWKEPEWMHLQHWNVRAETFTGFIGRPERLYSKPMTESELEKLVIDRLRADGLLDLLDRHHSQFLWVGAEFFAEVVLTDAFKQPDTERLLKEIAAELRRTGTSLDYVVRSLWQVLAVHYLQPARTPEGGLMMALDFRAKLKSGTKEIEVRVDVTIAALTVLRQKLGIEEFIMHIGWSPEKGDISEDHISAAVMAYLETQ